MRRAPSDRVLRRWLKTGRPKRVERLIAKDEAVSARLEALTALDAADLANLATAVTPKAEFEDRTLIGVQERRAGGGVSSVVTDLVGLGFHVGRVLLEPPTERSDEDRDF